MAGLRADLYQRMLAELGEQAVLADQLGYDSISFTEHHFHVEGFELSNNPVMLDLFVGMQTRQIRVGQLGIVLPTHNPIRVAGDIAMLDHMSGGRACAGFARGYQRRWVDTMAQQNHGIHGALPLMDSAFGIVDLPGSEGTLVDRVEDPDEVAQLESGLVLGIRDYFRKQDLPHGAVVPCR